MLTPTDDYLPNEGTPQCVDYFLLLLFLLFHIPVAHIASKETAKNY